VSISRADRGRKLELARCGPGPCRLRIKKGSLSTHTPGEEVNGTFLMRKGRVHAKKELKLGGGKSGKKKRMVGKHTCQDKRGEKCPFFCNGRTKEVRGQNGPMRRTALRGSLVCAHNFEGGKRQGPGMVGRSTGRDLIDRTKRRRGKVKGANNRKKTLIFCSDGVDRR